MAPCDKGGLMRGQRTAVMMPTLLLLFAVAGLVAATTANAETTTTTSPATTKSKHSTSTMTGAACVRATGVPGCSACSLAGGKKNPKHSSGSKYTCTRCSGDAYEITPVKGVCACSQGHGRLLTTSTTLSSSSSSSSSSTPAHSSKNNKKGGSSPKPKPLVAPCAPCPQGTVSAAYAESCVSCADNYGPYTPATCVAACSPLTCADIIGPGDAAACGRISDGCQGFLECGGCSGDQVCDPGSHTCACANGQTADGQDGSCLTELRLECASDAECESGLCQYNVCIANCPTNSIVSPSGDGCVCAIGSYGPNAGNPPCLPCTPGATTLAVASTTCQCTSPALVWDAVLNECKCPEPGQAFVNGQCRKTTDSDLPPPECTTNDQCASGLCVANVCSQRLCADGTAPSGQTGCLCGLGTWSITGETPCVSCGTGATTSTYGSTSCSCTAPIGGVWMSDGSGCTCPPDRFIDTTTSGVCLLRNGEECAIGAQCASGICDLSLGGGRCAAECPAYSTLAGSGPSKSCVCNVDAYGAGGVAPCSPCLGDSTTNGLTGQSSCACPEGKGEWSVAVGACVCPSGSVPDPSTGICGGGAFRLCTDDAECVGGVCSDEGLCLNGVDQQCPVNSVPEIDGSTTTCLCAPNFFSADGQAAGDPGCVACVQGSYAPLPGSTSCTCSSPAGSVWTGPISNTCQCLQGMVVSADGTQCLVDIGGDCTSGGVCSTGICSSGICVASCPIPGSEVQGGTCVCSATYFSSSTSGQPPCVACGDGSTNTGTGNTACQCSTSTTGEVWSEPLNACECPVNQELANGRCRGIDGETCAVNTDCVSNTCDLSTNLCIAPCSPPTIDNGSGTCVCPRNTFSATGQGPTCTACGLGSTTDSSGATACLCESPIGSVWTGSTTNSCACPVHQVATSDGICKLAPGEACTSGYGCSTGLCDQGVCVSSCPSPSSEPDGIGGCRCSAGYFGGDRGQTPCTACGLGSTSTAGSSTCTCSSPATWSGPVSNTCQCAAGFSWSGTQCTCLATTCSPLCPSATSPSCPQGSACESGQCLPTVGSKCVNRNGFCGLCAENCGNALVPVCSAYNLPTDKKLCQISAVSGGGRCYGTAVCCSVVYPYYITPSPTDGSCSAPA